VRRDSVAVVVARPAVAAAWDTVAASVACSWFIVRRCARRPWLQPPLRAPMVTAGAHQLSLPLRDGWNMVALDSLLIAIAEQDERYASERYGDQRSEGGAKIGFPIVGCLVVRHRDLRLSALCRQRLHRIEVPARVATRRNPALPRGQARSPRCPGALIAVTWFGFSGTRRLVRARMRAPGNQGWC
jgi:hypothetical protein